jgi:hypothetical protein
VGKGRGREGNRRGGKRGEGKGEGGKEREGKILKTAPLTGKLNTPLHGTLEYLIATRFWLYV